MRKLFSVLPRPSRYLGIEEGTVFKNTATLQLHLALAFPDLYEIGMSYLGHKILSDLCNSHEFWWAERVFAPCVDTAKILREHETPLCTLESNTPLNALDVIGFSVTHELCYTNILYMLDLANIPLRASDRKELQKDGTSWPFIIAGGGCTLAAEPLAPFMDIMLMGEGEECLPSLLHCIVDAQKENLSREATLLKASYLAGVYIPEFFVENVPNAENSARSKNALNAEDSARSKNALNAENSACCKNALNAEDSACSPNSCCQENTEQQPEKHLAQPFSWVTPKYEHHTKIRRQIIAHLDDAPYPAEQAIAFGAIHNRLALEIARGCTRGCRFCQAGNVYRPARERSVACLQKLLEECLTTTGFDDVSFLSLSTGDYSALKHLSMATIERCALEQVSVSLPSLRVGSIDDSIMESMAGLRRTGATLAPEAGSQRLRDVINKGVTEEDVLLHVQKLYEHGWQQVKLYFMLGLPTETDDDVLAILDLCKKARDAAGPGVKGLQITAAVSPFVPKPYTPFQWEEQAPLAEIQRRIGVLLTAIKGEKRLKLRWHEPAMSFLEGIFSRGDRRLAPVVETAYRKGAVFPNWREHFALEPWVEAVKEHGLIPEDYTGARDIHGILPWDHLESGVSKAFLLRERKKALEERTTTDCRYTTCHECGVCDTKTGVSLLREPHGASAPVIKNQLNFAERDQEVHSVQLDEHGRVIPRFVRDNAQKRVPPQLAEHLIRKAAQWRLWYRVIDNAVFISQLELQSIFERVLRKTSVPLTFSRGFHPLPLLSFGRARPVGVASECEWMSLFVSKAMDFEALIPALNTHLPRGLAIVKAEELGMKKEGSDALYEKYFLENIFPAKNVDFMTVWDAIAKKSEIPWSRETKKGVKELDARSYFKKIVHIDTLNDDAQVFLPKPILYRISQAQSTGVLLSFDWQKGGYISPLALCSHVLTNAGFPVSITDVPLTKLAVTF